MRGTKQNHPLCFNRTIDGRNKSTALIEATTNGLNVQKDFEARCFSSFPTDCGPLGWKTTKVKAGV
jgi:hypothetical protein